MFVDPNAKVPVVLDGNTIFIRTKMSAGVRAAVQDEMRARGFKGTDDMSISGIGSYRLALLRHNIVGWEGPAFNGIKCNRENISLLDLDEPLIELVAEQIGLRNEPKESPDPNALMTNGDTTDGATPLPDA
jgi:hypothetical protein